jgi:hypothetical protein
VKEFVEDAPERFDKRPHPLGEEFTRRRQVPLDIFDTVDQDILRVFD